MLVLARKTHASMLAGGEDGEHRLPRNATFHADRKNVELGFESDAEASLQQLEMLEAIRVAAGQTS